MGKKESVGVSRQVDNCGRVTIPSEFRDKIGIDYKDIVVVSLVKYGNKYVVEIEKEKE